MSGAGAGSCHRWGCDKGSGDARPAPGAVLEAFVKGKSSGAGVCLHGGGNNFVLALAQRRGRAGSAVSPRGR